VDDPKDYLDIKDAIDVPWDELRSERTLRKILDAAGEDTSAEHAPDPKSATRNTPWLWAAAAALMLGTAGVTAIALQPGEAQLSHPVAQADSARPLEITAPSSKASAAPLPSVPNALAREVEEHGETGNLLDDSEAGSLLAFADGARARLGENASVRVLLDTKEEIRIGQDDGQVVYDVSQEAKEEREIVVEVAHLFIMVQGSRFAASLEDNKVSIEVEEGSILIDDGRKQLELVEGDSLRLERQVRAEDSTHERRSRPARTIKAGSKTAKSSSASADELMRRADEARRSGDLAASASALHQLVEGEAKAPPVAWMTLGRVERRRGNHEAAAKAFESYWKHHAGRPLAEDALHQAFMSRRAAGQSGEARRIAEIYLQAFPAGLHAAQMAPYSP
jgi:TolA-binding protein